MEVGAFNPRRLLQVQRGPLIPCALCACTVLNGVPTLLKPSSVRVRSTINVANKEAAARAERKLFKGIFASRQSLETALSRSTAKKDPSHDPLSPDAEITSAFHDRFGHQLTVLGYSAPVAHLIVISADLVDRRSWFGRSLSMLDYWIDGKGSIWKPEPVAGEWIDGNLLQYGPVTQEAHFQHVHKERGAHAPSLKSHLPRLRRMQALADSLSPHTYTPRFLRTEQRVDCVCMGCTRARSRARVRRQLLGVQAQPARQEGGARRVALPTRCLARDARNG